MKFKFTFLTLILFVLAGYTASVQTDTTTKWILGANINFADETVWNAGAEYMLSRNFSLMASYDNRFGAGGGLTIRF